MYHIPAFQTTLNRNVMTAKLLADYRSQQIRLLTAWNCSRSAMLAVRIQRKGLR